MVYFHVRACRGVVKMKKPFETGFVYIHSHLMVDAQTTVHVEIAYQLKRIADLLEARK
jgi:hypothetical protein